jgi:hypothetical protein
MRRWRARGAWLPRLVRRWRPDGNPLRRTSDRIETALLAILVVAFLCGAPLAGIAAGSAAAASSMHAEHAQPGAHRVAAVLLQRAPGKSHPMFQVPLEPMVPAQWKAPDGMLRTGEIYAPAGAAAGSTVLVWTDRSGQLTASPLQRGDEIEEVALAASLATMAVAAVRASHALGAGPAAPRRVGCPLAGDRAAVDRPPIAAAGGGGAGFLPLRADQ